jgi:ethanolamine utilization protein EutQ (cupin superfamily)
MGKIVKKSFDASDETRPIPKGKVDVVKLGDIQVMRQTFEPGFRWSESMKSIAKTDSCQIHHLMYIVSGRLGVRMNDGSTAEFGPGDVGDIPSGHDAWVVGNVPCVNVDFGSAIT